MSNPTPPPASSRPAARNDLPAPPPVPRPITPRARRQAWLEPRVRIWWVVAAVLVVVAGLYTVKQYFRSSDARWFHDPKNGLLIEDARIEKVDGIDQRKRKYSPPAESNPEVEISFMYKGEERRVTGRLDTQRTKLGLNGPTTVVATLPPLSEKIQLFTIPIYIDRNNPTRWTDRLSTSWTEDMILDLFLVPVIILLAGVALFRRMRLLNTWQKERAALAVVVESTQSAAFPRSRIVRMTLQEGSDHRIITTVIPRTAADPRPGELFWLISPHNRPQASLVACLYG